MAFVTQLWTQAGFLGLFNMSASSPLPWDRQCQHLSQTAIGGLESSLHNTSSTVKASLQEGSLQFGYSPECVVSSSNRLSLSCFGGQPRGMTRTCIICGVNLEPPFWTMQKRYPIPVPGSGFLFFFFNGPWFLRTALSSHTGYPQTLVCSFFKIYTF